MADENILVTDALLAANDHLTVESGDTVHPSQVTAAITQEMLDEDPTLVERGLKVGDLLNAPAPKPSRSFSASISGVVAEDGTITGTISGDIDGEIKGSVEADNEAVTATIEGTLQPAH